MRIVMTLIGAVGALAMIALIAGRFLQQAPDDERPAPPRAPGPHPRKVGR